MNRRKQLGPSVWMLALLNRYVPDGWDGSKKAYVASGNIISDEELSDRLQVSRRTIAVWRRRLRKAGFLEWLIKPGEGRSYILTPLNKSLMGSDDANAEYVAPPDGQPMVPNSVAPKREAAQRWLQ